MARYIDADALYQKLYPLDLVDKRKYTINAKAVADAIANIPTADVAPKSEVARGIFEEIDKELDKARIKYRNQLDANGVIYTNYARAIISELKKKYTEGEG